MFDHGLVAAACFAVNLLPGHAFIIGVKLRRVFAKAICQRIDVRSESAMPMRTQSATRLALTVLFTIESVLAGESTRIYVYADPHAAASSWKPVSCDGGVVAKIKDGYFFALKVSSGRHTFAIADGTPTFVNLNANQDLFLRVDEHIIIGEPKILILTSVAPDLARQRFDGCHTFQRRRFWRLR